MKKTTYNIQIIIITILLLLSIGVTVFGVVFRNIKQPEVKLFGRTGLAVELTESEPEVIVEPVEEIAEVEMKVEEPIKAVVTEAPAQATKPLPEPVVEQAKVETPKKTEAPSKGTRIALTISHYTDSAEENGGYAGLDAMGQALKWGTLASNNFKKGTQIYIEQYEHVFTVSDVGSSKYLKKLSDGSIKVDVFIPRKDGESRADYKQRALNLGIIKTYGYVQ